MMRITLLALLAAAVSGSDVPALKKGGGIAEWREKYGNKAQSANSLRRLKHKKEPEPDLEGSLGKRQACSDKRTTMICDWGANADRRRLVGVELVDIKCTLGVGIKPPSPDKKKLKKGETYAPTPAPDYKEYSVSIPFPDDSRWCLGEIVADGELDYFSFDTDVVFTDVEIDGVVGDITGSLGLSFETFSIDKYDFISYDGSSIGFSC